MAGLDKLDLMIKNGSVVLKNEVRVLDIGIKAGRIVQLGEELDGRTCGSAGGCIRADCHGGHD